jgi:hypothetical protein
MRWLNNESIWQALRQAQLPDSAQRRSGAALTDADRDAWNSWLGQALMPANRTMCDVILHNADLLVETTFPEPLRAFCAHVAAYEVLLSVGSEEDIPARALVDHPGERYVDYVRRSFLALKAEQVRLLGVPTPAA